MILLVPVVRASPARLPIQTLPPLPVVIALPAPCPTQVLEGDVVIVCPEAFRTQVLLAPEVISLQEL